MFFLNKIELKSLSPALSTIFKPFNLPYFEDRGIITRGTFWELLGGKLGRIIYNVQFIMYNEGKKSKD